MKYILCLSLLILVSYSCEYRTVRLENYEVHGIDISHYQSRINWDTVAGQNIHFAFVKATEGVTYRDSLYCHNWEEMKRVGIKRGAYHFFRPAIPADEQARNFFNWVKMEYGDLPPVLDVEVMDGVSKVELISGIRTWLFNVEIRYNIKPILYTNLKFYNKYLAGHFNDYPIWIARYHSREPRTACGRNWQFWQYGNRGRIAGIKGEVDFNVFNGSLMELESMCLAPQAVLSESSSSGQRQFSNGE
jgi:lysozyme